MNTDDEVTNPGFKVAAGPQLSRTEAVAIARVCHEANRTYCATIGDLSHLAWEFTRKDLQESAIAGVLFAISNPSATSAQSHWKWCETKKEQGWRWGPEKDLENRLHPCLVAFDELPEEHRRKDALFLAVVRALTS